MRLFQHTILKKQIAAHSEKIKDAYRLYAAYFLNPAIQENIRNSKEEQFQEGFLRELFVKIFGYTLNPEANYNLITEKKNETDSKKADGAIIINGEVKAVIELKDHKTTDLKQVEIQAFGYKNNNRKTSYVVISNFEKLRFYIENTIDFEEFNLFALSEGDFAILWICLAYENIASDLPKQLKSESINNEDRITKKLYKDYSSFKRALFDNILANNKGINPLVIFKKTQKLLDRFLFVFFSEDKGLLPPNSMKRIIDQWEQRNEDPLNEYQSLYSRFKLYFKYMNEGHKGKTENIFGYNGGLFKPDEVLDTITMDDDVLKENILKLIIYDFDTEVDVNILGHIFENSLSEIEEITNQLQNNTVTISKRKKDGVFYTPRYITTYIVENTLGKLCNNKKEELGIADITRGFIPLLNGKLTKATIKPLSEKLEVYREWLLSLTICDPACGSGAFLNAALDFLMSEHRLIDELTAKLFGGGIVFPNIENAILENNLYGVDINEESVEIARLALWLRTAKPQRKLNSLNNNIKCGNSLIDNKGIHTLAIENAFDWYKEFPQVFKEKDKQAYHVTTAIHDSRTSQRMIDYKVREKRYDCTLPDPQVFPLSNEEEIIITKTIVEIVKADGLNILAYNICYDHLHLLLVCEAEELDKIVGKIKGKTARVFNNSKGMNPLVKSENECSIPLWTQKFGYKEITDSEQLYNTIDYIENNRIKHELPNNKGIHPLVSEICCSVNHAFRPEYKGGFDVVIGNPPYVPTEFIKADDKKYLEANYQSAFGRINLYPIFYEKGLTLLSQNGLLGFITPYTILKNQYYKEARKYILDNSRILELIDFKGISVFEDAAVDSIILILKKEIIEDYIFKQISQINSFEEQLFKTDIFNIKEIRKKVDLSMLISENDNLIEKINQNTKPLNDIVKFNQGIITGGNSKFLTKEKSDLTEKVITGSNFNRYSLNYENQLIIYDIGKLHRPRKREIFEVKEKILLRQTGAYPICTLDTKQYYTLDTVHCGLLINENFDIKYIVALLNSRLIRFLYESSINESGKVFAQVKIIYVDSLPIKDILLAEQHPFIVLADKMLTLNSNLQIKRERFLKRLSDNFSTSTNKGMNPLAITGALERFEELEFKQFLTELQKQKITLSLKQQDEWEEYFNDYKTECTNFVSQIIETDKEIDRMVYALYGLTEEEIKIVKK